MDTTPRSEPDGDIRPALEDLVADMACRRQFLKSRHPEPLPVLQRRNAILHDNLPFLTGRHIASLSIIQRRTGLAESGGAFINAALEDLVKDASTKFDVVIIEATPVMLIADALILAQLADVVVQAVRWHATPKATVVAALKRLRDASARIDGIVLTGVNMNKYRTFLSFFGALPEKKYRKYYAKFD